MTEARRVYLDHAATTPPAPEVVEAMLPYLGEVWHNPSSIYVEAQRAAQAIDEARATVATWIGAQPEEIIFTSGGSESDNLALRGVLAASKARGQHLITNAAEHHAVLDTAEQLEREGAEVTLVDVGPDGRIDPEAVADAVRDDTVLVTIMHANNEVGAMNDIAAISRAVHERNPRAVVHTDAVQSAAHMSVNVDRLGVDLLTLTAHKFYGPRGAGVLYARTGTPLAPQVLGGGQESNRRAGTENTPGIVGLARAVEIASERREADISHERALQQRLIEELPQRVPMLGITGPTDLEHRLPGNVSAVVGFVEGESILLALDLAGVAASSGSACTTGAVEPSHVLVAMGVPDELARGSLRFTLGRDNTDADVDHLLDVLPGIVERMRALSPVPATEAPAEWEPWLANGASPLPRRGVGMTKSEMVAKIGSGVRLQTLSQGVVFDLHVEEFGLVFVPATGKVRRTPWDGKQWNWRTSVPDLFDEWATAGKPDKTRWLRDLAVERGGLSGYWNASYLLATFDFLAD